MSKKIESFVFFLLLVSIPIQLGRHFWPPFAFVSGIRVDYLSPTLYVSDCIVVILFLGRCIRFFKTREYTQWRITFFDRALFVFILICIPSFLAVTSFPAAVYGAIKLLEFIFIGRYVAKNWDTLSQKTLAILFAVQAAIVSVIAITEFFVQHSIGGLFYFLGERTFYPSTPGIALADIGHSEYLRPYATFPHPNVLAYFLCFVSLLLISEINHFKRTIYRVIFMGVVILAQITLLLTFSRVILLLDVISLCLLFFPRIFKTRFIWIESLTVIIILFFGFGSRFLDTFIRDLYFRANLLSISWNIFWEHPFFGVGFNNFYYYEVSFQRTLSPTFLQPVHSIYALMLVEMGIVGTVFVLWVFYKTFRYVYSSQRNKIVLALFSIFLIAGLFDHYFVTLQQGQLLTAIIVGLCWNRVGEE